MEFEALGAESGSERFGRSGAPRVAVTRSDAGSPECELSARIAGAGLEVVPIPLTRAVPPVDPAPLDEALSQLRDFDWLVVTSPRTVDPLHARLGMDPLSVARAEGLRVCAVGPGTARSLRAAGIEVDVLPDRFRAEGIVEALLDAGLSKGQRVLFPRGDRGRDVIPRVLGEIGVLVESPVAYRTVTDPRSAERLVELTRAGSIDALTFTAGSAASAFAAAWRAAGQDGLDEGIGIFALGPATAEALSAAGIRVDQIAEPHTFEALADAATHWLRSRGR